MRHFDETFYGKGLKWDGIFYSFLDLGSMEYKNWGMGDYNWVRKNQVSWSIFFIGIKI